MIHSDNRSVRGREVINYRQVEKKILDEILGKKVYDTRLRPPGHNNSVSGGDDMGATLVHVNIFVRKRCSGNKLYLNPQKVSIFWEQKPGQKCIQWEWVNPISNELHRFWEQTMLQIS